MFSITRKIECDIGHRIPDHGSQCKNIHGHRYVIEATCHGPDLAIDGESKDMILDFSFLKADMMDIIHQPCDHGLILSRLDPLVSILDKEKLIPSQEIEGDGWLQFYTTYGKVYVINASPTAEALAKHWYERLEQRVRLRSEGRANLASITVYETPNCWAVYPA